MRFAAFLQTQPFLIPLPWRGTPQAGGGGGGANAVCASGRTTPSGLRLPPLQRRGFFGFECGYRNAEGAEIAQRAQRKYQKWGWVGVKALCFAAALPAFSRRACQLKALPFPIPLPWRGTPQAGGGGGGGANAVCASGQRTTPSGYTCHPSNGGEFSGIFCDFCAISAPSAFGSRIPCPRIFCTHAHSLVVADGVNQIDAALLAGLAAQFEVAVDVVEKGDGSQGGI